MYSLTHTDHSFYGLLVDQLRAKEKPVALLYKTARVGAAFLCVVSVRKVQMSPDEKHLKESHSCLHSPILIPDSDVIYPRSVAEACLQVQ